MNIEYNHWRLCDICGHEGFCRRANQQEVSIYDVDDVCQRCDGEDLRDSQIKHMKSLLIKIRDSGQWFYSALEFDYDGDGEALLKEIEALVGEKL